MKQWLFIFLLMFLSSLSFAEDEYYTYALEAKKNSLRQIELYKDEVKQIVENKKINTNVQTTIKNEILKEQIKNPTTSILIFVSFSMPRQSLEAYLRDAKKIGASVIIRGLINNSFQKTFHEISDLVKASDGQGMELNPIWFKRFHITQVPAVVVISEQSNCFNGDLCHSDKDYDLMTGDISLLAALKMVRDRGVAKDIAQIAMDKLLRNHHV